MAEKPTAMKTPVVLLIVAAAIPTASGTVIYQDDFSGSAATPIHNTRPDVQLDFAGASPTASWSANSIILSNGANGASLVSEGNTSRSASLPFTPQVNYLYDYQISMSFAEANTATRSMQMGFFGTASPGQNTALTSSNTQGPVIFFRNAGSYVARAAGSTELTGFSGTTPAAGVTGLHTLRITLDTSQTQWVMRTYFDGVEFGGGHTFTTNPTIGAVGFAVNTSGNFNAAGTFSNFSLSATAIPEPAAPLLLSFGLATTLARRTRKRA